MVNLTINNLPVSVEEGTTIMEAARQNHITIPSLCYLKDVHQLGACRICVVEVEGARFLAVWLFIDRYVVVRTRLFKGV